MKIRDAILGILLALLVHHEVSANVVGSDAQNFNPTTSGLDFVTVQSSETLDTGVINIGLFANYAKNPLPSYNSSLVGKSKPSSSLTGGDLNIGIGVMSNWDAGISFPAILAQDAATDGSVGRYSSTGNTEIRFNTKLRVYGDDEGGVALVGSVNANRITKNPYVGEGGGLIYNLELAGDTTVGNTSLGFNLGYRWRNPGSAIVNSGIEPIGNQALASAAISYHVDRMDSKVIFELLSAFAKQKASSATTDRDYSVLETVLGIKHDISSNASLQLGGGAGLLKGVSSPDYRVYLGLNIAFGSSGAQRSVQLDPYKEVSARAKLRAEKRRRILIARAQAKARARAKLEEQAAQDKVKPQEEIVATASESSEVVEPEMYEVGPAKSEESIRDVKVFNRGSFNHIVLQNIEFIPQSMTLTPSSEKYLIRDLLPALRELNRRRPIGSVVVEGHTDSIGDEHANQKLSKGRAEIIANLLKQNLDLQIAIETVGAGESSPIADNANYQGRALNNRVEVKVLYQRKSN